MPILQENTLCLKTEKFNVYSEEHIFFHALVCRLRDKV